MNQPRESIDAHVLTQAGLLDPVANNFTGAIAAFPATLSLADAARDIVLTVIPEPGILTAVFGGLGALEWLGRVRRLQLSASAV